jgi:hypothetical protein
MALPMIGSWTVRVNDARPFTIHGDEYVELHVTRLEDRTDHLVRVPRHALRSAAPPGSSVALTFLMGQVTEVVEAGA